jgi:hypothetical protein
LLISIKPGDASAYLQQNPGKQNLDNSGSFLIIMLSGLASSVRSHEINITVSKFILNFPAMTFRDYIVCTGRAVPGSQCGTIDGRKEFHRLWMQTCEGFSMSITKQRTLDYINTEWGMYVERFGCLPRDEGERRVRQMGYERFRDMLAHILAWWEEGMTIILAIAENREFERRKYDFDVFNAEAVAKYRDWDEREFMAHFEKTRQKMAADIKSINEVVFENRRVKVWLHGILFHHAREHLVALSRFLVLDMLENNWATYIEDFQRLDEAKKREFLAKQGFASFHDLIAHVIGWWEEGARIILGIMDSPSFTWESHDVDAFNLELMKKFSAWSDADLLKHFESVRLALIELTADLPEDAFRNNDIEGWLRDDVVVHYDEHPIPA